MRMPIRCRFGLVPLAAAIALAAPAAAQATVTSRAFAAGTVTVEDPSPLSADEVRFTMPDGPGLRAFVDIRGAGESHIALGSLAALGVEHAVYTTQSVAGCQVYAGTTFGETDRQVTAAGLVFDVRKDELAPTIGVALEDSGCGASMTTHSSSSPTTQMLLSTSKVSPSREKVPRVTAWSTRRLPLTKGLPSEDHDGPQHARPVTGGVHPLERRLHVADADLLADEGVEVEPALQVEVHQHREVTRGEAVAVPARLERTPATEDVDQGQVGDLHVRRRYADQHHRSGQVAGVEGLLPGLRPADGLDHDVRAEPAGQLLD